jgi:hypothetical protein
MDLTMKTLEPWLTEGVRHWLQQGYGKMLSSGPFIRVPHYWFQLIFTGSGKSLRIKSVKNRVANH